LRSCLTASAYLIILLSSCSRQDVAEQLKQDIQKPEKKDTKSDSADSAVQKDDGEPMAGGMVMIPAVELITGSRPDVAGRDHSAEVDEVIFSANSFEMDTLPYPGEPEKEPLTGISWDRARTLCEEQGKRLCTELEYETACKGPDNHAYAGGNTYREESYAWPGPRSAYGILGQGTIAEWMLDDWEEVSWEKEPVEKKVVRGTVPVLASGANRRCARRSAVDPSSEVAGLGFRCCRGPANSASIRPEPPRSPWKELTFVEADRMASIIRSVPEISHLHDAPRFFSPDDLRVALIRGSTEPKEFPDFIFTWRPIRWTPEKGLDLWVLAGISGSKSFIAVLYKYYKQDRFLHAASMTFLDTPVPLMLIAKKHHREEIWWGFCWGCRESGTIRLNEEGRVVITHKW